VDGFGLSSENLAAQFVASRQALAYDASLQFSNFQRPVTVWIVLDRSGSMEGRKLDEARAGVLLFLGRLRAGRGDKAGLLTFSDTVEVEVELGPLADVAHEIIRKVNLVSAAGGTSLLGGIMMGLNKMPRQKGAIRAVVVLTDGCENRWHFRIDDILSALAAIEVEPPRVYCLSYGEDANTDLLGRIASASRGVMYVGTYSGIEELFERIGYHF